SSIGVGLVRAIPLGRRPSQPAIAGQEGRRSSTSALTDKGSTAAWRRIRSEVLTRDRHTCQYCGAWANTVDHRIPRRVGGTDDRGNLVACCVACQSPEARPLHQTQQVLDKRRVLSSVFLNGRVPRHRAEEHTSELQSHLNLVCRLLLEK